MEITLITKTDGKLDPVGVVERQSIPEIGDVIQLTTPEKVINLRVVVPSKLGATSNLESKPAPSLNTTQLFVERLD